ncbi:hypothetical protein AB9Q04_01000 [Anaerococcus sp. ENR1011]|uniref:DUF1430 domain-containing protein n=1 Tax=Anaerococcus groningensis TaxID=3115616 RepID=A0ABW9MYN5_9FIRM
MKRSLSSKLLIVLLVIQSLVFAIATSLYLDQRYRENFDNLANDYKEVSINNIDITKGNEVGDYIANFLKENQVLMVKKVEGPDYTGKKLLHGYWMSGDYEANKEKLNLKFLDKQYASDQSFKNLDKGGTIGLLDGDYSTIEPTPRFILGDSYFFINLTGTGKIGGFNGEYQLIGIDDAGVDRFYEGLSKVTGLSVDEIKTSSGGSAVMGGGSSLSFIIIYVVLALVIITILTTTTVASLKNMGVYLLQGWSKKSYIKNIYNPINKFAYFLPILFIPYGFILTKGSFNTLKFYLIFLLAGLINLTIFLFFELLISLILRTVKPIDAIHGRTSKKGLLIFGMILFMIFNTSTSALSFMDIDNMIIELKDQIVTKKEWENVSDYYVTTTFYEGDDFEGDHSITPMSFQRDFYRFYQSIENEDGVKFINTDFRRKNWSKHMKEIGSFDHVPDFSYLLFTANKNYIEEDMQVEITNEMEKLANEGYRVYLIPESFSKEDRKSLEIAITEMDEEMFLDETNDTDRENFNIKFKGIKFFTYNNNKNYFAYPNNIDDEMYNEKFPSTSTNPVINYVNTNNMSIFESLSLISGGETNSEIKLNQEAYDKFANKEYFKKYNIDDNKPEFVQIRELIGGMIRSLTQSIFTFLLIALLFLGISAAILSALINLYREIYLEEVNIKKFLGYDNKKIYKSIFIMVIVASIVNLTIAIINGSVFGICFGIIFALIELILLRRFTNKNQFEMLVEFLK